MSQGAGGFPARGFPPERGPEQLFDLGLVGPAILDQRLGRVRPPRRVCLATSPEFRSIKLCPRLASPTRSHSHGVSRLGRPNVSRKAETTLSSGNSMARVPAGSPANGVGTPETWGDGVEENLAPSRLG